MYLLSITKITTRPNLTPHVRRAFSSELKRKPYSNLILTEHNDEKVKQIVDKCAPKLIYNSVIERDRVLMYNVGAMKKLRKEQLKDAKSTFEDTLPVSLKYYLASEELDLLKHKIDNTEELDESEENLTNFPYEQSHDLGYTDDVVHKDSSGHRDNKVTDVASDLKHEIQSRSELLKEVKNWMTAYDNYDDDAAALEDEEEELFQGNEWKINYGTSDSSVPISNTPCGGCGALLHCRDTSIPGYIPSEIFKNQFRKGGTNLEAITCQRCHFLKHFNIALQTRVTPEEYPNILATVARKQGIVILMVDLMDFPCSIWPGIADIFAQNKTPIVVIGNKVDLLPKDSQHYLKHVKQMLLDSVKLSGFGSTNIKHVALISAKTGFGIEELVTDLGSLYRHYNGDYYIVGCTNVGKSSLFNALLQSDFCKVQAMDLVQRATTSVWPGTTLNLLKFPIKRPSGYRQYLRHLRLTTANRSLAAERESRLLQLRKTRKPQYATLIGHIGVTRVPDFKKIQEDDDKPKDRFAIGNSNASGKIVMGLDENKMEFSHSKWCFDTPGVVQPDQIIHLLSTDELLLTLPKSVIMPRTYCIKPGSTLFIGGLSRLDYLENCDNPESVKLTVFASDNLPITVCSTDNAEEIYGELLGSELFKVPFGNSERLSRWPGLEMAKVFSVIGDHWKHSVNDVVLSSSGWIAITGRRQLEYKFQAWTPEKRGVFIRESLLPHAVALSGDRIRYSVAYKRFKFYLK